MYNAIPSAYNPQQYYENQMAQMQRQPPIAQNPINWVQGEVGAKSWQVPPNGTAVLFDSEQDKLYIKTADNIGMCNLRTFNLSEATAENINTPTVSKMENVDFVKRSEFDELKAKIEMYENMFNQPTATKNNKKVVSE